ncbi:50S ribosomal protein L30 [Sporolactobacillus kofuensis]|uniref:Large ribosomal subunit protein uL30 n=2 Tax=Sporolactobacillus TaxID=2077 RepID=A0A1I2UYB2_9BACL|nr:MULTISPECIES: 50S ribosomal protein L30 [Sporolactobacillus]MCO7176798.1 50S ribosomal protein L30 [Sporolactobacillus kofuensis]SFG82020.1 LSU ribosomal protein L30P [Sporolactobacillus nakayamae]
MAKKLEITLKHSVIGRPESQRVTVRTLGLRKTYQTVVQDDNPAIRGMINKVSHLLAVRELND